VFVGDQSFTVTEPNDMRFLQYFYQRIIAPEHVEPSPERGGIIGRLIQWVDRPGRMVGSKSAPTRPTSQKRR
jgi:hypothetical protein